MFRFQTPSLVEFPADVSGTVTKPPLLTLSQAPKVRRTASPVAHHKGWGQTMLRIDPASKRLVRLQETTLADASHWERQFQDMVCASPDEFCKELAEKLWIIGQEVRPSEAVPDRIDILAIDDEGRGVIVELKRGTNKLQLLQAISYAGMIAQWSEEQFVATLAQNYRQPLDEARADIQEHITELAALNQYQRIILIAEDFDPALLISAEWLHENYEVDIRCYRIALSHEDGKDYLTCSCIYPPLEIASLKRGRDRKSEEIGEGWTDWGSALEQVDNTALVAFYKAEFEQPATEKRLRNRELIYRIAGKRRLYVNGRRKYAYVWQEGRFPADDEYWRQRLSDPNTVIAVKAGRGLRFHLSTTSDFDAFGKAVRVDLLNKDFTELADFEGPETVKE
jgi:hypothetical protein